MTDSDAQRKADAERKALDTYLGKNIRQVQANSSLLQSTSKYLNHGTIREVLPVWLLRKNGPDFPVEADHTLGLRTAFNEVVPRDEIAALMSHERAIKPELDAWFEAAYVPVYTNDDFTDYPAGTVGAIIDHQIRVHGFDLALGVGDGASDDLEGMDYWYMRSRQAHDFEHILAGGQFNSLGEVAVTFTRVANEYKHFSPALAAAITPYQAFSGLRMVTRAMLHYPAVMTQALRCMEQGIMVGRESPPFWFMLWEEVFHMTPKDARAHFGVPDIAEIDTHAESILFRQDPADLAQAAE